MVMWSCPQDSSFFLRTLSYLRMLAIEDPAFLISIVISQNFISSRWGNLQILMDIFLRFSTEFFPISNFMYKNRKGLEGSSQSIKAKSPMSLLTILLINGLLVLYFQRSAAEPQLVTESSISSFVSFIQSYKFIDIIQLILNNMKNRQIHMQFIEQNKGQEPLPINDFANNAKQDSSDFSDFDLAPKDIGDRDFSPYHKTTPILAKQKRTNIKVSNKQSKAKLKVDENKKTLQYKKHPQSKSNRKKLQQVGEKKKKEKAKEPKQFNSLSFGQNPVQTNLKYEENSISFHENLTKNKLYQRSASEYDSRKDKYPPEELIVQYNKREFKNSIGQCVQERQNSKPKRHQKSVQNNELQTLNMAGSCVFQSKGGLCFDLDVKEFKSPPQKRAQSASKNKKKKSKKLKNLNSNEQILKRRQMAFNYGKLIRMRTFGYL